MSAHVSGNETIDDQEWKAGIRQRECSCHVMMKRPEYQKHFKDGTHNDRMRGSAPKEVTPKP